MGLPKHFEVHLVKPHVLDAMHGSTVLKICLAGLTSSVGPCLFSMTPFPLFAIGRLLWDVASR